MPYSRSVVDRARAVEMFEKGYPPYRVARQCGLPAPTVFDWYYTYTSQGADSVLCMSVGKGQKHYDYETKLAACTDVIENGLSHVQARHKYGIRSDAALTSWLHDYKKYGPDGLKRKKRVVAPKPTSTSQISEIDQLRQRVKDLEAENAYLKAWSLKDES